MPSVIVRVAEFVPPLGELVQFAGDKLDVSCSTKSEADIHEIVTCPGAAGTIVRVGGCKAAAMLQKPPSVLNSSLLEVPASHWPTLASSENSSLSPVPPPPP